MKLFGKRSRGALAALLSTGLIVSGALFAAPAAYAADAEDSVPTAQPASAETPVAETPAVEVPAEEPAAPAEEPATEPQQEASQSDGTEFAEENETKPSTEELLGEPKTDPALKPGDAQKSLARVAGAVPRVEVDGAVSDLDPTAENTVTVRGYNFLPDTAVPSKTSGARPPLFGTFSGAYVAFGSYAETWQPSAGAASATRVGLDVKWAVPVENMAAIGGTDGGAIELKSDGSFVADVTLTADESMAIAGGQWGIATYSGSGAKYAPFETFTPVTFADPNAAPRIEVDGAVSDLDPTAENTVTVRGYNFLPDTEVPSKTSGARPPLRDKFTGSYVAFGSYAETWQPSVGAASDTRSGIDVKWAVPAESFDLIGGTARGAIVLQDDGSFETKLTLTVDESNAVANGRWGIATYAGGGATFAPFETFTAVTFAGSNSPPATPNPTKPKPDTKPRSPGAGSLNWGVSSSYANYTTGPIARGEVRGDGVGGGPGGYLFPQSSGTSWNSETRTGTVRYSGSVTFSGHGGLMVTTFSNPVITVTSPISGTISAGGHSFSLNLAGAAFKANADGSVTWSNVPVSGQISGGDGGGAGGSFGADSLSFTVGSASGVNFGSTTTTSPFAKARTAAPSPPATTGVTVVTPEEELVEGGEIEITAAGFEPNEQGILVVIYSEPTVLDENAKADANGVVRWIGTIPEGLTGKHTITLQGSINVGQEITIAKADAKKAAVAAKAFSQTYDGQTQQAGIIAPADGAPVWVWWAAAVALLILAGASTGLVIAQRHRGDVPTHL